MNEITNKSLYIDQSALEDFSDPLKEEGFSCKKYIAIALISSAIALHVLTASFSTAMVLFTIGAWYLASSITVLANRSLAGTVFAPFIQKLHAFMMEINSGVDAMTLFPITWFSHFHKGRGSLEGRPILLVNGYLSYGSTWNYQRKKLVEAGLGPIYIMNVASGQSIIENAKHVHEKAEEIELETGRKDLILIGHSKGGLVSSYYATHRSKNVTDVITIGSPLNGTPVAKIGFGKDAREMEPNSRFIETLRKKIARCTHTNFFHIGSTLDPIVSISSSIMHTAPSKQLILKDLGHLALISSSRVTKQICSWIKTALPSAP